MASPSSKHSFRASLFRNYFISYFALILVPAIAACALAQVLAVSLIENDARKLSDVMVSRVSDQTDASFLTLRTSMIGMLSGSGMSGLLRTAGASLENHERSETIHALRQQLAKLQSDPLATHAYLYLAHEDMVVDAEAYSTKSYFFKLRYPLEDGLRHELTSGLKGRKMLDFILGGTEQLSTVISYPFNSDSPEVYLIVQLNQQTLGGLLRIPEPWAVGTALLDGGGAVIGQSGLEREGTQPLHVSFPAVPGSAELRSLHEKGISLVPSQLANGFAYLSVVDMPALMKPVAAIRIVSWSFLLFFLIVGALASYYLSRRSYGPIREIRESIGLHPPSESASADWRSAHAGELAAILDYSRLIVMENRQLSKRVDGLMPVLREHLWIQLLLGEGADPRVNAEWLGLHAEIKPGAMTVLCIDIHGGTDSEKPLSRPSRHLLLTELRKRLAELLPSPIRLAQLPSGLLACVVESLSGGISVAECAGRIRIALQNHAAGHTATIGIGREATSIEGLPDSCRQATAALQQRGLGSEVEICVIHDSAGSVPLAERAFLPAKELNRVMNLCGSKEYEGLLAAAHVLISEGAERRMTAIRMKSICTDLLHAWIRAASTDGERIHASHRFFEQLECCMTGDELRRCFTHIHGRLFPAPAAEPKAGKFADVLAHIHEHYHEELSLDAFAVRMNMSASHFSRLFKEEVGEKYVEYLAMYRLKKAKELLLSTDLRIDDIAGKVGYWGRHSFIRVFRKYEGITPAQYRSSKDAIQGA